jgi:hypothetical protein
MGGRAQRDGYSNILVLQILDPDEYAANQDSDGVDLRDYDAVAFAVMVGDTKDAGFAVSIEESDDALAWAAAAAADVQGPSATLAVDTLSLYGYIGDKRYVRVACTIPGATEVGICAIKQYPHKAPVQ